MHQHVVAFTAWRYRRDLPGAEATLRRVADEGILLVSTGGGDYTHPRGEAIKVDGGYRVTGRKRFASQSAARHGDGDHVHLRRPRAGPAGAQRRRADRVAGRHRRRQLGHPRHARHRQQRHRHRGRVRPRRAGARQPPVRRRRPSAAGHLRSIAFPIISGVYLGVAEAAYHAAVAARRRRRPTTCSCSARSVSCGTGCGSPRGRSTAPSAAVGDDPSPSAETTSR